MLTTQSFYWYFQRMKVDNKLHKLDPLTRIYFQELAADSEAGRFLMLSLFRYMYKLARLSYRPSEIFWEY